MTLPTTTRARLNLYRKRASESKWANDWRKHRYASTWGAPWHNWSEDRRKIYTEARDTLGDYLGDWTQLSDGALYLQNCRGFYTDDHCHETIRGGVVRLRGARFTLYIPCTYCTGWDGATLYYAMAERVARGATEADHETAAHEAARTAYGRAEHEADVAREDNAKHRSAEDIEQARADIHELNRRTMSLLAEIRKAGTFSPAICQALTNQVRESLAERREHFATIAKRKASFWSAVAY